MSIKDIYWRLHRIQQSILTHFTRITNKNTIINKNSITLRAKFVIVTFSIGVLESDFVKVSQRQLRSLKVSMPVNGSNGRKKGQFVRVQGSKGQLRIVIQGPKPDRTGSDGTGYIPSLASSRGIKTGSIKITFHHPILWISGNSTAILHFLKSMITIRYDFVSFNHIESFTYFSLCQSCRHGRKKLFTCTKWQGQI